MHWIPIYQSRSAKSTRDENPFVVVRDAPLEQFQLFCRVKISGGEASHIMTHFICRFIDLFFFIILRVLHNHFHPRITREIPPSMHKWWSTRQWPSAFRYFFFHPPHLHGMIRPFSLSTFSSPNYQVCIKWSSHNSRALPVICPHSQMSKVIPLQKRKRFFPFIIHI